MSKLENLQGYKADIYGRAERNGAKAAVDLLAKLTSEAVEVNHEKINSLERVVAILKDELSNHRNSCDSKIAELEQKLESKADIPYPKAQECLTEWAKEGRKYCKDEHVELTASEIGSLTVKSIKRQLS